MRFTRQQWKTRAVVFLAGSALGAVAYGLWSATSSPLFTLRVVEVTDLPAPAPVDAQAIQALVGMPQGSLFRLDLEEVERRILSNPWIREVRLKKRFPQTLTVSVEFREPKAMLQKGDGTITFLDDSGLSFGRANPGLPTASHLDLPVIVASANGFSEDNPDRIAEALQFVDAWNQSPISLSAQVASLSFDREKGFRALITYPITDRSHLSALKGRARAYVELGQEIDADRGDQLKRLDDVVRYLSTQGISARQIWADAGKKIVVKIARGS